MDKEVWGIVIAVAVVGGGIIAALVLHLASEARINREHKRLNDDRIADGLPPLSREELGLYDDFHDA
jgi:hypothetical protein